MKKSLSLIVASVALLVLVGCSKPVDSAANKDVKLDYTKLIKDIENVFKEKGKTVVVKAEELKKLTTPNGFSYVQLTYEEEGEVVAKYKVFTDGKVIAEDLIDAASLTSIGKQLEYETLKPVDIPTDNLTLVSGNKKSKNVIIEITDFQCPFCKKANNYLSKKLVDKKDYSLYIVHLPLDMHVNASTMARIFEAGMLMGKNFADQLFNDDYDYQFSRELEHFGAKNPNKKITEEDVKPIIDKLNNALIEEYAALSGDPKKFKELLNGDLVNNKLINSTSIVTSVRAQSTPMFYVNGKLISGFDEQRLEKVLSEIK